MMSHTGRRRIVGLDTLRFVCAVWVAMHHGARPMIALWLGLSQVAQDLNSSVFDGVAAVIVFFIISGLCVHQPYAANNEPCRLQVYFVRRFVRIGIPLLVVVAFEKFAGHLVGDVIAHAPNLVLWSLWCELIYYAVYPVLLLGFRRFGVGPVLAASFVAATLVIAGHWSLMTYAQYSRTEAWIAALPAWLLGCVIAEKLARGQLPVLQGSVWAWRAAALLLSIPPKALVYIDISPVLIGNPATLGLFAIFAYFWVMKEIETFMSQPPLAMLERGGRWSYSLYLVHNVIIVAFIPLTSWMSPLASWPLRLAAILLASYLFYLVAERPAHIIARRLGRRLSQYANQPERQKLSASRPGI
jgi:peptidoglycan/LPS O-acetylase OafA/YrhL